MSHHMGLIRKVVMIAGTMIGVLGGGITLALVFLVTGYSLESNLSLGKCV